MPLWEDTDKSPTNPRQDIVRPFKPGVKTAVIDTEYTPQSDLLAYIEGSPWVVDYYSQILDKNSEIKGQDTSLPAPLQQYRRIWSMELKVTQDLTQVSQDPQTNEMTMQGAANVYPFLVPQEGDMFRAGIADGREGIFKITKVQAMQIFVDHAHQVEYQLVAINDQARIYDLDQKTIVTYYFVKDFLLNQQNPLLVEDDYQNSKKLAGYWYDYIQLYFNQYFSREYMTIVVPMQDVPTYDHGIVDFVKSIMNSFDDVHIQAIRELNIGDDGAISSMSLWTMLSNRDPKLMNFIYTKTGVTSRINFHRSALLASMRYSGIAQVVYPVDPKTNVDFMMAKEVQKPLLPINIKSTMPAYVPPTPPTDGSIAPMPIIKPIDMDNGYVLSSAFYTRDNTNLSLLESLLLDYIDFKIIAARDILKVCDDILNWGHVERFYYIPLLLLLIKYNLRRL